MSCDCITTVAEKLTCMMIKKNDGAEVEEPCRFQNVSWILAEPNIEVLSNPVFGKYRVKGRIRKWEINMVPNYCPYCGKKYKK
jgi:hypothetical protein